MLPIAVILQHPNDEQSRGLLCVLEVFLKLFLKNIIEDDKKINNKKIIMMLLLLLLLIFYFE